MVLGACSCVTQSCEHTASVYGCNGQQTQDGIYCDGDQIFYDVDSFVYDTYGTTCNAEGGSSTLECSCTSASPPPGVTYSSPNVTAQGFYADPSKYDNSMPTGPCQCDIYVTNDDSSVAYVSLGDTNLAAYCDGGGDVHDAPTAQGGALYFECGTGYTNSTSAIPLKGIKDCRCTNSSAPYYGADSLGSTAVAGAAPIPSRVATLSSSLGSSGSSGSSGSVSGSLVAMTIPSVRSLMLTLAVVTWIGKRRL